MYDYMSCHCDHDLKEGWQSFHNILTLAHDVLPQQVWQLQKVKLFTTHGLGKIQ